MSGVHRSYSFQSNDDNPEYHPLAPNEPRLPTHPEYHDHDEPPPPPVHQQSTRELQEDYVPQRMESTESQYVAYSGGPGGTYAADSESNFPGNRNSGTVVRKVLPPAAAAAASASLEPVRNDLAPPVPEHLHPPERGATPANAVNDNDRYWGQEVGYSRSNQPTPSNELYGYPPATPPSMAPTPASHAPLLGAASANSPAPLPPPHGLHHAHPGGSSDRLYAGSEHYTDNPYKRASTTFNPALASATFDATAEIMSDDDDNEDYGQRGGLSSGAAGGGGATGAGGGSTGGGGQGEPVSSRGSPVREKPSLIQKEEQRRKRIKWLLWAVGILVILGIAAGTAAGVLLSRNGGGGGGNGKSAKTVDGKAPGGSIDVDAKEDTELNGDLSKDSKEIQELMSNDKLHKVFHGIDYTPLNGVYPECEKWPPAQNNITRDIAVMSLLTDKIRLYGNDCNQTAMVFHAIDQLEVDMRVWVGVWLDGNQTTNDRQIRQLWDILEDEEHMKKVEGIAVGNEVLFGKYLTEVQLVKVIEEVRQNVTKKGYKIPVGTSDLGDNWTANMAAEVDVLMANVHPFFAGVKVEDAASWTLKFFTEKNVALAKAATNKPRVMISEVGWPSAGGKDKASVAGIDEMNRFMEDFVCQQNEKGTEYFWFSAFDEPWKVKYNEPKLGKEWEDKWGLMDVNRKLKDGLVIPDCK